jgi:hypothetical protein
MIRWLRDLIARPKAPVAPTVETVAPPRWTPPEPTEAEMAVFIGFQKNPDRSSRRGAVIRVLEKRLDDLLGANGFRREGADWVRELPSGRARVSIQRFRQGVNATLVSAFEPKPGKRPPTITADSLSKQLPNFVQMAERTFVNTGSIDYAFADHDPAVLDFPLAVLRDRALPWMLDHADGSYPDWKTYRDRPFS